MKDEKKVSIFCPISKRFFKWISIGDFDNHFFCELNFTLIHRKFSWNCWSTKEEKKVWPSVQTAVWKCNSEVIGNFICSSFNTFALSHTSCVMNEPVWNSFFSFLPQSCTMYTDTLCFILILGDQVFIMIVCVVAVFSSLPLHRSGRALVHCFLLVTAYFFVACALVVYCI